jgi:hypothetical protein
MVQKGTLRRRGISGDSSKIELEYEPTAKKSAAIRSVAMESRDRTQAVRNRQRNWGHRIKHGGPTHVRVASTAI